MYAILCLFASLLLLFSFVEMHLIFTYSGQSKGASYAFSIASAIVESLAILVGVLGLKSLQKTSIIIILISLPMLFWSFLMFQKPSHIGLEEVVLFWWIYIIGMIVLSITGLVSYKKEVIFDDGILDSGI